MFNHTIYENSRPDGFPVLEVVEESEERAPRRFVPLAYSELTGEISGPMASLRLTQVFRYSSEQCPSTLEAFYRFPLPGDAAVTGIIVRFGETEIRSELKERSHSGGVNGTQDAEPPALTIPVWPDVFTLRLDGLQPDEDIRVETTYVQSARVEGLAWSIFIPLATVPHYGWRARYSSCGTEGRPLGLPRDPGHHFCLDVLVRGAASVESPTYALATTALEEGLRVRLREDRVLADRDCVLRWQPPLEDGPGLRVLLDEDVDDGHVYFLALVTPPAQPTRFIPREVVLLVDHSGSMSGASWDASDWAVSSFLQGLTPHDYFAVGVFHEECAWWEPEPVSATPDNVARAVSFLRTARNSGGTDVKGALRQALRMSRALPGSNVARHIIIVTDENERQLHGLSLLSDWQEYLVDPRRVSWLYIDPGYSSISPFIDTVPEGCALADVAAYGRGVVKWFTSYCEEEDLTHTLERTLAGWSAPWTSELRFEVDRPWIQSSSHQVSEATFDFSALDLGDPALGRPVSVIGRTPRGNGGQLTCRLRDARGETLCEEKLALDQHGRVPGLSALFGAQRLRRLHSLRGSARYYFDRVERERAALADFIVGATEYLHARAGQECPPSADVKRLGSRLSAEERQSAAWKSFLSYRRGLLTDEELLMRFVERLTGAEWEYEALRQVLPRCTDDSSERVCASVDPVLQWARETSSRAGEPGSIPKDITGPFVALGYDIQVIASRRDERGAVDPVHMERELRALLVREAQAFGLPCDEVPLVANKWRSGQYEGTVDVAVNPRRSRWRDLCPRLLGRPRAKAIRELEVVTGRRPLIWYDALDQKHSLFCGSVSTSASEVILADLITTAGVSVNSRRLSGLELRPLGRSSMADLDTRLSLLVYVGDLAAPRLEVRLVDLTRHSGVRPINIGYEVGERLILALKDPNGAWKDGSPCFEVLLG